MKTLIVYSSWFGQSRRIAQALAPELARRRFSVSGAPLARVRPSDVRRYELLVLGADAYSERANRHMHDFCETIPLRLFDHVTVALFGVQPRPQQYDQGVHALESCLAERGIELAVPPLAVESQGLAALLPWRRIDRVTRRALEVFADDLWEAAVPEPMF
jgi:menaquinone-dependent protoporphyrinogen IX oxidase